MKIINNRHTYKLKMVKSKDEPIDVHTVDASESIFIIPKAVTGMYVELAGAGGANYVERTYDDEGKLISSTTIDGGTGTLLTFNIDETDDISLVGATITISPGAVGEPSKISLDVQGRLVEITAGAGAKDGVNNDLGKIEGELSSLVKNITYASNGGTSNSIGWVNITSACKIDTVVSYKVVM